jgi:antitoxin ParD1/3/4
MDLTLNISLPASLRKWVERRVAKEGYDTADDFVIEMLRREQAQEARSRIDARLLEAFDSGESTPMTGKDWERIRSAGRRRFQARRKK